ncbi:MAG: contractile injection system protein, VgrG/Pvc8 family [Polyangiaceae bacterium]
MSPARRDRILLLLESSPSRSRGPHARDRGHLRSRRFVPAPRSREGRASSSLPFRADNGMGEAHEHIRELRLARHLSAESATLRDHDLLRPLHTLEGRAEAPRPPSLDDARAVALGDVATRERYEPYGSYLFPEVSGDQARTMLEQERSRAREAIGASGVRALAPGRWFTLEDHPDAAFHREYVVTRVRHRGRTPEWSAALARSAGAANARAGELAAGRVYENEFECVPASVPFRPRRPKHLVLTTVETATVVGPTEHEIHTDRLGRVKVQFHWDRHGARDERSSC